MKIGKVKTPVPKVAGQEATKIERPQAGPAVQEQRKSMHGGRVPRNRFNIINLS